MGLIDALTGNEVFAGSPESIPNRDGSQTFPVDTPPTHSEASGVGAINVEPSAGAGFSIYPDTPAIESAPVQQQSAPVQQQYAPQGPQVDSNALYWQNQALQSHTRYLEQQFEAVAPVIQAVTSDPVLQRQIMERMLGGSAPPSSTSPQTSAALEAPATPPNAATPSSQQQLDPRVMQEVQDLRNGFRQARHDLESLKLDRNLGSLKQRFGDHFNEAETLQFALHNRIDDVGEAFVRLQGLKAIHSYSAPVQQAQPAYPQAYAPQQQPQYQQQQYAPQQQAPQYAPTSHVQPYSQAGYGPPQQAMLNAPPPAPRVETPRARVSPSNVQQVQAPRDWAEADQLAMQMARGILSRQ